MSVHANRIAKVIVESGVQMAASEREMFKKQWKEITNRLKTSGYDFSKIILTKKEG